MILGFPRAKQGLCHTKHGGAGGIILWALLTVFLVWDYIIRKVNIQHIHVLEQYIILIYVVELYLLSEWVDNLQMIFDK